MKYKRIYNYIFIFTYLEYFSSRKEPEVMYAINDTFDDVRDGDIVQNEAFTNKSKDTQVRTVSVLFSFKGSSFQQTFCLVG